jgi:hypothetical protein
MGEGRRKSKCEEKKENGWSSRVNALAIWGGMLNLFLKNKVVNMKTWLKAL